MTEQPDDIVGHKTFSTDEICSETGFPVLRHEPLTRAEANAIFANAERRQKERKERMPDEQSAIDALFKAWARTSCGFWTSGCGSLSRNRRWASTRSGRDVTFIASQEQN